jgi:hypothetical protein
MKHRPHTDKAKEWNRGDVAPLGKRLYRRLATGLAFYFTPPMPVTKTKMPHARSQRTLRGVERHITRLSGSGVQSTKSFR